MILTLTLNSALDQVLVVDRFVSGSSLLAPESVWCVGGKGLDASVALRGLGAATTGLALLGGDNGRKLLAILEAYGILPVPVWVAGETRICTVIAETETGAVTHIKSGGIAPQERDFAALAALFRQHAAHAPWAILAGSLPPGAPASVYAGYIQVAREVGCQALLDCSGEPFRLGIAAGPAVAKLNREEFASTFGAVGNTLADLAASARQVVAEYGLKIFIVTCGADGILAVTSTESLLARAPDQRAVNAAGAGDAVSAALCLSLSQGAALHEALRFAAAVGAASVLTAATAECRLDDVKRILPAVALVQDFER